ncbi:MAG TPA: phosphotransferase [Mycobacteriales bacterium]|nr:phosphotransferase [Mycobacteriales bacterium]
MRDEPPDLPLTRVAEFLRIHWGIEPAAVKYAPVGHGSHHWIASNAAGPAWFVIGDRLSDGRWVELSASAQVARRLADSGCDFVLAPIPDRTDTLVRALPENWALQVAPYVRGRSTDQGAWTDPDEQREIARMIGRVHSEPPPASVPRWNSTPVNRDEIESALQDLDQPWPGAEPTRTVLKNHRTVLENLLERYDVLLTRIEDDADPWVLTHGEPDSDNVIRTDDGRMLLIDWTSVAIAPRERDLFDVAQGPVEVSAAYRETAGRHDARPAAMELIGLYWRLSHLGQDIKRLRQALDGPAWERLHKRLVRPPSHNPAD